MHSFPAVKTYIHSTGEHTVSGLFGQSLKSNVEAVNSATSSPSTCKVVVKLFQAYDCNCGVVNCKISLISHCANTADRLYLKECIP